MLKLQADARDMHKSHLFWVFPCPLSLTLSDLQLVYIVQIAYRYKNKNNNHEANGTHFRRQEAEPPPKT